MVTIGALAATVALGACGSDHALTRTELVRRADDICLKVNRQAAAAAAAVAPAGGGENPRQTFIRATQATLPLSDRGVAQLRALVAPAALAGDWRRFLRDVAQEDTGVHQLVQAAQRNDLRRGEAIQASVQSASADLQRLAVRDGFTVCGRPQRR